MSNIPILFFDLDGVLLDSESNLAWYNKSIERTLNYFQIPYTEENLACLHFKNIKSFRNTCNKFNIEPMKLWPIRNTYYINEKLKAIKKQYIRPFPDIQALYKIKEKYKFGIISNSPQIIVEEFVNEFQVSDLFSINIGRGNRLWDIDHLKPDPYLFLKIKRHIKTKLISYIGDRETDREFARNTGMMYYHLDRNRFDKNSYENLYQIAKIFDKKC